MTICHTRAKIYKRNTLIFGIQLRFMTNAALLSAESTPNPSFFVILQAEIY